SDRGQIIDEWQSHEGVVDNDGSGTDSPVVHYDYTGAVDGNGVYNDGARPFNVVYPSGRAFRYRYSSSGSKADLLHRAQSIYSLTSNGQLDEILVHYNYNGTSRLISTVLAQAGPVTNTMARGSTYRRLDRF